MKPNFRIPVVYTDRPGSTSAELVDKSPTIEVVLGFDPGHDMSADGKPPRGKFIKTRALIDTGADDIFVDEKLLQMTMCPVIPGTITIVKTAYNTVGRPRHTVQMTFPGHQLMAQVEATPAPLDDGTRAYCAIFGTRFLEKGTLVLNPMGESYFDFAPENTTAPKAKDD